MLAATVSAASSSSSPSSARRGSDGSSFSSGGRGHRGRAAVAGWWGPLNQSFYRDLRFLSVQSRAEEQRALSGTWFHPFPAKWRL